MDGKAVIAVGIITVIVTILIVYMFPLQCKQAHVEGFQVDKLQLSCPSGSTSFFDDHGDLLCCSGDLHGNRCEGTILCSFSVNTSSKYPSCGLQKKRKYIGPINPLVQQMMTVGFVEKFSKIVSILTEFKKTLKTLPDGQVSKEDSTAYNSLVTEESNWYNDNMTADSITYQEECMYIIQRLMAIFSGKPIMNNHALIQKHVMQQMCKK